MVRCGVGSIRARMVSSMQHPFVCELPLVQFTGMQWRVPMSEIHNQCYLRPVELYSGRLLTSLLIMVHTCHGQQLNSSQSSPGVMLSHQSVRFCWFIESGTCAGIEGWCSAQVSFKWLTQICWRPGIHKDTGSLQSLICSAVIYALDICYFLRLVWIFITLIGWKYLVNRHCPFQCLALICS